MNPQGDDPGDRIEMPLPTAWPIVLSFGVALVATGFATSPALSVVGAVLLVFGLGGWASQLLPGRGHTHLEHIPQEQRPPAVAAPPGSVGQLRPGMVGYRFRLPEKMHPISAGIRGGIVGGLVMPIPALAYGLISGNGIWFPVNLLAGMVLPMHDVTLEQLRPFNLVAFVVAICIHAAMSVTLGLLYGVLLPTMPEVRGGKALWGGVLMPVLWTGISHSLMGAVNPTMQAYVDWRYFLVSQLVFGITASIVVLRSHKITIEPLRGAAARQGHGENQPAEPQGRQG
jgi:hypothetical protein